MEDRKLEIIGQLMEELQDLMGPTADDFNERLGKPKVEIEMKSEEPMDGEDCVAMEGDYESPEDKLKSRLMKLRG